MLQAMPWIQPETPRKESHKLLLALLRGSSLLDIESRSIAMDPKSESRPAPYLASPDRTQSGSANSVMSASVRAGYPRRCAAVLAFPGPLDPSLPKVFSSRLNELQEVYLILGRRLDPSDHVGLVHRGKRQLFNCRTLWKDDDKVGSVLADTLHRAEAIDIFSDPSIRVDLLSYSVVGQT